MKKVTRRRPRLRAAREQAKADERDLGLTDNSDTSADADHYVLSGMSELAIEDDEEVTMLTAGRTRSDEVSALTRPLGMAEGQTPAEGGTPSSVLTAEGELPEHMRGIDSSHIYIFGMDDTPDEVHDVTSKTRSRIAEDLAQKYPGRYSDQEIQKMKLTPQRLQALEVAEANRRHLRHVGATRVGHSEEDKETRLMRTEVMKEPNDMKHRPFTKTTMRNMLREEYARQRGYKPVPLTADDKRQMRLNRAEMIEFVAVSFGQFIPYGFDFEDLVALYAYSDMKVPALERHRLAERLGALLALKNTQQVTGVQTALQEIQVRTATLEQTVIRLQTQVNRYDSDRVTREEMQGNLREVHDRLRRYMPNSTTTETTAGAPTVGGPPEDPSDSDSGKSSSSSSSSSEDGEDQQGSQGDRNDPQDSDENNNQENQQNRPNRQAPADAPRDAPADPPADPPADLPADDAADDPPEEDPPILDPMDIRYDPPDEDPPEGGGDDPSGGGDDHPDGGDSAGSGDRSPHRDRRPRHQVEGLNARRAAAERVRHRSPPALLGPPPYALAYISKNVKPFKGIRPELGNQQVTWEDWKKDFQEMAELGGLPPQYLKRVAATRLEPMVKSLWNAAEISLGGDATWEQMDAHMKETYTPQDNTRIILKKYENTKLRSTSLVDWNRFNNITQKLITEMKCTGHEPAGQKHSAGLWEDWLHNLGACDEGLSIFSALQVQNHKTEYEGLGLMQKILKLNPDIQTYLESSAAMQAVNSNHSRPSQQNSSRPGGQKRQRRPDHLQDTQQQQTPAKRYKASGSSQKQTEDKEINYDTVPEGTYRQCPHSGYLNVAEPKPYNHTLRQCLDREGKCRVCWDPDHVMHRCPNRTPQVIQAMNASRSSRCAPDPAFQDAMLATAG